MCAMRREGSDEERREGVWKSCIERKREREGGGGLIPSTVGRKFDSTRR